MRFFYLDPGLRNDVGHHANYCRYIVGELRRRGVETLVFGHRDVSPSLQAELGATPHFGVYTYTRYSGWGAWLTGFLTYFRYIVAGLWTRRAGTLMSRHHVSIPSLQAKSGATVHFGAYTYAPYSAWRDWLTGFGTFTRITCEDLFRLPALEAEDIVFATSAQPVQLSALIKWRRILPPDRRPTLVVESSITGLVARRGSDRLHISMPDPVIDPIAALFRYVARQLPRESGARFHFTTFSPTSTELFNALLQYPVRTLPLPYRAVAPLRNRAGTAPPVVAVLGHQRLAKGYDRLPEIVQELLRLRPNIRLLVQNVVPSDSPQTEQALRDIAASSDRVVLVERPLGRTGWPQLLEMSDIILCPYRPEYYLGFSAVLAEALANGIPVVVPAGTPMEALLVEYGGPGTAFDRFEPASIAAATGRALDQFDHFAALAHAAGLRWPETRGPARMVEELMSLISRAMAFPPREGRSPQECP